MTHRDVTSPPDLDADVWTADGTPAHVRGIRPDDDARLVAFHAGLSPETIYMRFFGARPTLPASEVLRFTNVDFVDRVALVATIDDRLVAVARYDRVLGSRSAEVAFVVDDEHQHHGLGPVLLERLAVAARHRGIAQFLADTLATNTHMLRVFAHAGYAVHRTFEAGVIRLSFSIEAAPSSTVALEVAEVVDHKPVPAAPVLDPRGSTG